MNDVAVRASLNSQYVPVAVYYEDADTVEYVRKDIPYINRRIDDFLTLTLEMHSRQTMGFRLKGFKNFYLHHLMKTSSADDDRANFLKLISVIEAATKLLGNRMFDAQYYEGYKQAYQIAEEDNAALPRSEVVNG